jgi:rSAM/selenodomain-associated transferase 1
MKQQLVVMLKEPHLGRVKTRLAAGIGAVDATWWFRHQTRALLRRLEDPRWELILAVSPDAEGLRSPVWPLHLGRIAQGRGSLGDRMTRIFRGLPRGPVIIIGGDIPEIEKHHIAEAFATLGSKQGVFGPAPDGGYWLIGLKRIFRPTAALLSGVRWSTPHALADSKNAMAGLSIGEVATLRDVDTVDDLEKIAATNRA